MFDRPSSHCSSARATAPCRSWSVRPVAQPSEGPLPCKCGAKEWVYVPEPKKAYKLGQNDRDFLKSIRVTPER